MHIRNLYQIDKKSVRNHLRLNDLVLLKNHEVQMKLCDAKKSSL